ncbi:hypothetical protein GE061_002445 [Apolygus lucorum]|uniref:Uncharacterized protein n=1 Tax=Apolygus lucorum TaxID=248454 RepID=A0A8S9X955_APOLU|nr:hypothetical protein GE061_002445 [Apolygus lucorum]
MPGPGISERTKRIMGMLPQSSQSWDPLDELETSCSDYNPESSDEDSSSDENPRGRRNRKLVSLSEVEPVISSDHQPQTEESEEIQIEGPFPKKRGRSVHKKQIKKMKRIKGESFEDESGSILLQARPLLSVPVPCGIGTSEKQKLKHQRRFSCKETKKRCGTKTLCQR